VNRPRSALRNHVEFAAYRLARALAGMLGPRSSTSLGEALGGLFWRLGARRRGILRFNLSLAFPELDGGERINLERRVSRQFGRTLLDALRVQAMSSQELGEVVRVSGVDNIQPAAELGRGLFYLSAHIGLWELAGIVIGAVRPEEMRVINRPLDNPLLDAELARFRGMSGNIVIGKANIALGVIRQLKSGGSVGILIDQRVPKEVAVEVPFFGRPTRTHPILARMVLRTRAPVVPVFSLWEAPGRYEVRFGEPVIPDSLASSELDEVALTARYSAIVEDVIRQRPEQWLWFHDRWRHLRVPE
jgi:KDO2-lipid IV(A) lauroyltransferase